MQDVPDPPPNTNSPAHEDKERSELTPLYSSSADSGALRLIVAFFFGFSLTLTVALGVEIYYGKSQVVPHGAVSSDDETCSNIGASVMKQGGNAVDSAIAVAFCMGVVNPHLTGLASGGFMLIYNHRDKKVIDNIDFRATRSRDSGIGVPGFVAGLHLAHQLYGKLPWKTLVMPAYQIARDGFKVSQNLLNSQIHLLPGSNHNRNLRDWLSPFSLGEIITNIDLADTLLLIADSGPNEFYNKTLVNDLKLWLAAEDIVAYKPLQSSWLKQAYEHYDIIASDEGSGGPFLLQNLASLNNSLPPLVSSISAYYDVAAAWRLPSASNVATVDVNDLYVSIVSGLGEILGSQILTPTGYILNNILETTQDINIRPTILSTPVMVIQNGNVCGRRFIFGGGDVRDVAQALTYLLRNPTANVTESITAPRVRITYPSLALEMPTPIFIKRALSNYVFTNASLPYPSINVVQKIKDDIAAVADYRGYGGSSVF